MKRRNFLKQSLATASVGTVWMGGMLPRLARAASQADQRQHVILLWMAGGPSQTDTFDMKPHHENGGEFQEVATNVPGVRFSEHFPGLAQNADKLAIVRSLTSKEGDHERGSYLLRTGHKMGGPARQPALRSLLSHQLAPENATLPPLVAIEGRRFISSFPIGPEFLGPKYQSLDVSVSRVGQPTGDDLHAGVPTDFSVDALQRLPGIDDQRWGRRLGLWQNLQSRFMATRGAPELESHLETYQNACQLMDSDKSAAFDLSSEPVELRQRYGMGSFGQGCLLARRLIEAGVSCVEVTLSSSTISGSTWDSHSQNFVAVKNLSLELDAGFSALLEDLQQRGLLQQTTVVCMGEFGRTPRINSNAGRDHFPRAFSGVMAGGRTAGGQTYGETSEDGNRIIENPVTIPEWLATICQSAGVSPAETVENESGRPVPIVDAQPIEDLLI